ncbi:lipid IV(A) 3-deoxy-D-manno-octulosonic acid transferase [Halomonas sp. CH40]
MDWPRLGYSAALYALSPLIWQRVWREQVPTYQRRQRLGIESSARSGQAYIWLHCASVGEVRAAQPLIKALLARYPRHHLLLTTMTASGAQQVQALTHLSSRLIHRFIPLDFPGSAKRFVRHWQPALAILFETELWPNLIACCHQHHLPVAVVNGRLSPRAFKRYQRIRPLMVNTLRRISWLAAKSQADAERFAALGMSANRTQIVGSLKFEISHQKGTGTESKYLRRELGLETCKRPVWVAGSTREGEEAVLLAAHRKLGCHHPEALLILAPRHPQRFDEVAKLCEKAQCTTARRSLQQPVTAQTQVYLADTLGELEQLYTVGDLAFVGGSLVPLGGHNVVEPASLGRFTLCGPSLENFEDVAKPLQAAGALESVADEQALVAALVAAFDDPEETARKGALGQQVVEQQRGALERTLAGLVQLLPAEAGQNPD